MEDAEGLGGVSEELGSGGWHGVGWGDLAIPSLCVFKKIFLFLGVSIVAHH